MAEQKKIVITNNVSGDHRATFDLILISTVIRKLLTNAIKFTPLRGNITINSTIEQLYHVVTISDTGIGICPDRIGKVFDKTYYESTYGTEAEKGSGLGLKLCMEFVESHNGKIGVNSVEGKGSTFYFTLPVDVM